LYSGGDVVTFNYRKDPSDTSVIGASWSCDEWHARLASLGFVLLPMIWRSGAVVRIDDDVLGCLICPPSNLASDGNFITDGDDPSYLALVQTGGVRLKVIQVLDSLVPAGTAVCLKLESNSSSSFVRRLPSPVETRERRDYGIRARISFPDTNEPVDGKVFVMVSVSSQNSCMQCEVLQVDPWDICLLASAQGRRIFDHIEATSEYELLKGLFILISAFFRIEFLYNILWMMRRRIRQITRRRRSWTR
jgi:hypothetical protein